MLRGKSICTNSHIKEEEISSISSLNLHLKKLVREQTNQKQAEEEKMNTKLEISEVEKKKQKSTDQKLERSTKLRNLKLVWPRETKTRLKLIKSGMKEKTPTLEK